MHAVKLVGEISHGLTDILVYSGDLIDARHLE